MQFREGSFHEDRPSCPRDPEQRVHQHGHYERYADCEGVGSIRVPRFYCPRCGRTLSVLPKEKLPYIAPQTVPLEAHFDALASGTDPPSASERLQGCVRRAWKRLATRVGALCAMLGQLISTIKPDTAELWRQLRSSNRLHQILLLLAGKFKTSLLADYRCLRE